MRKRRSAGCVLAVAGGMILLAVLLPTECWWVIVGAVLLLLGLSVIKC